MEFCFFSYSMTSSFAQTEAFWTMGLRSFLKGICKSGDRPTITLCFNVDFWEAIFVPSAPWIDVFWDLETPWETSPSASGIAFCLQLVGVLCMSSASQWDRSWLKLGQNPWNSSFFWVALAIYMLAGTCPSFDPPATWMFDSGPFAGDSLLGNYTVKMEW